MLVHIGSELFNQHAYSFRMPHEGTDCDVQGDKNAAIRLRRRRRKGGRQEVRSGVWYPRWYWPSFTVPGVLFLLFMFVLPLYVVISVAFGTVDYNHFGAAVPAERRGVGHVGVAVRRVQAEHTTVEGAGRALVEVELGLVVLHHQAPSTLGADGVGEVPRSAADVDDARGSLRHGSSHEAYGARSIVEQHSSTESPLRQHVSACCLTSSK